MRCTVNGSPRIVPDLASPAPLLSFLAKIGVPATGVIVEMNGDALPSATLADATVRDGDCLEIVSATAGG